MNSYPFPSESLEQTQQLGRRLGELVQPGMVISLVGDLGAGKTQLTTAIAAGLGINPDLVSSPTFMLIQEYQGRIPLFHFDTYRLKDIHEFEDLGVDEYFYGEGVCLVEWGDRFKELLPDDLMRIEIQILGETQRQFDMTANGTLSESLLASISSKQ